MGFLYRFFNRIWEYASRLFSNFTDYIDAAIRILFRFFGSVYGWIVGAVALVLVQINGYISEFFEGFVQQIFEQLSWSDINFQFSEIQEWVSMFCYAIDANSFLSCIGFMFALWGSWYLIRFAFIPIRLVLDLL